MADIDSFKKDIQSLVKKNDQKFFTVASLSRTDIRTIDFNDPAEKAIHHKLISLVDRSLDLHKTTLLFLPPLKREVIEHEITVTAEKSGEIVCGLYGIMEADRIIIQK